MKPKRSPASIPDAADSSTEELPHERDQATTEDEPDLARNADIARKGAEDVERGVEDTTRGAESDRVYDREFRHEDRDKGRGKGRAGDQGED